jgi:hypothetical protein
MFYHGGHGAAVGRNQFLPLKTLNSLNTTFYGKESYEYQAKNFLKKPSFARLQYGGDTEVVENHTERFPRASLNSSIRLRDLRDRLRDLRGETLK